MQKKHKILGIFCCIFVNLWFILTVECIWTYKYISDFLDINQINNQLINLLIDQSNNQSINQITNWLIR